MKYIPEEALRTICDEFEGTCSLYISLPFAGEKLTIRADEPMKAASTIKIPLLALLMKDAEEGRLDLDAVEVMDPVNRVRGSGILKFLSPDTRLSLYDYAVLMMNVSDNSATNHIIDAVGMERANAFFAENGWTATALNKKLFIPAPGNPLGTASTNLTSAGDLGNMLERIFAGTLVSQNVCQKMMSIMACQQLGKFDKGLNNVRRPDTSRKPLGPVPEGKVFMVQKGGTLYNDVSHDAAIMLLPNGRQAIMVMMTQCKDGNTSLEAIKKVSRAVYDRLMAD